MKFYVQTLARTKYRQIAGAASLLAFGVPFKDILMIEGRDGADYDSAESMFSAMCEVYPSVNPRLRERGRGSIGYVWSCCEVMDRFINSEDWLAFLTLDDCACFSFENHEFYETQMPYFDLIAQTTKLLEIDPELKIFQVFYHNYPLVDMHPMQRIHPDLPITKGIHNMGDALVITKPGAELVRDLSLKFGNFIEMYCYFGLDAYAPGLYSTLTRERWKRDIDYRLEGFMTGVFEGKGRYEDMILAQKRSQLDFEDYAKGEIKYMAEHEYKLHKDNQEKDENVLRARTRDR